MAEVELARVLPGAQPLNGNNINDLYTGLILLSDGSIRGAHIKDLDIRQLSNEVFAFVLAKALQLPIPDAFLGIADPTDLAVNKAPQLPSGGRLVFASASVKTPNLTFRVNAQLALADKLAIIDDLIQWSGLGNIYAFDSWVANTDRHAGNLLFGGQSDVWMIDHGHCFTGQSWVPSDLKPNLFYRHKLKEWLTVRMDAGSRGNCRLVAQSLQPLIDAIDVAKTSTDARLSSLLPATEVASVVDFVTNRKPFVDDHTRQALEMLT